jgi:hypothetical protein
VSLEAVPLSRLPHGEPARLLTAASVDPARGKALGVRDAGAADTSANEAGFFPQCFVIELMGQTAGLAIPGDVTGAYVASISGMRLRGSARRGERIDTEARLLRRIGSIFLFRCRATASGRSIAQGSIALRAL